jgi:type VI secretion system secreted protein VgrG
MCKAETPTPEKPGKTPGNSDPKDGAQKPCHPACTLSSETAATSPANRKRTKIGVGEDVVLTVKGNPATWAITSGTGDLSPKTGTHSTIVFTADDKAGSTTITATGSGCACVNTITFTVVRPASWTMKKKTGSGVKHTKGHPDCGFLGVMYVHPNDVNFYNVETREKDSLSVGSGVYHPSHNGQYHGSYPLPDRASSWFLLTRHTETDGSTDDVPDQIYSGYPGSSITGTAPPFKTGNYYWEIVIQWRVVGGATIHDFPTVRQEHEIFADGKCETRKGGLTESAIYSDPTSSW